MFEKGHSRMGLSGKRKKVLVTGPPADLATMLAKRQTRSRGEARERWDAEIAPLRDSLVSSAVSMGCQRADAEDAAHDGLLATLRMAAAGIIVSRQAVFGKVKFEVYRQRDRFVTKAGNERRRRFKTLTEEIATVEAAVESTAVIEHFPEADTFRRQLPSTRRSLTHKFEVGGHEGYLTVGFYPDGRPGELFIRMAKEGSTVSGLMDAIGAAISICLQYGVPPALLARHLKGRRFEPSDADSSSVVDYIGRWLECQRVGDLVGLV